MNKALAASLICIALIVGMGIGYSYSSEYQGMLKDRASGMVELGRADRTLDLRYLRNMIAHHRSAIFMLEQAKTKSHRQEVRELAGAVIAADLKGITMLNSYKKDWYSDTKEVTVFNKVNLGDNDEKFDLRLLNALVEHHTEAIESAKEVRTKSTRTEVLNVADETITALTANRTQLETWRKEWYGN